MMFYWLKYQHDVVVYLCDIRLVLYCYSVLYVVSTVCNFYLCLQFYQVPVECICFNSEIKYYV